MATILVVTSAFGPHAVGDHITDPVEIGRVLESDHAHSTVRVSVPVPEQEA